MAFLKSLVIQKKPKLNKLLENGQSRMNLKIHVRFVSGGGL